MLSLNASRQEPGKAMAGGLPSMVRIAPPQLPTSRYLEGVRLKGQHLASAAITKTDMWVRSHTNSRVKARPEVEEITK